MVDKFSYLSKIEPSALEEMYQQFLKNPDNVEESWKKFFAGFEFATQKGVATMGNDTIPENFEKEFKVIELINAYRHRGHLFTKTNPVRTRRSYTPTLDIENFGLSTADINTKFQAGNEVGIGEATLQEIVDHLKEAYCQTIGVEYTYIRKPEEVAWLKEQIEFTCTNKLSKEEHKHILYKLSQAVVFEDFLQKKFVGQKRFSIEGAEILIPALDALIEYGSEIGISEFIMGMSHRGRLNVLTNILNKTYQEIFNEFEGKEFQDSKFDGDVKYHLGYSSDFVANSGKKVHLTLSPNPSHLEAVGPVIQGIARAKEDSLKDNNKIVPILIHGDAAMAGQGVVYEVIQMAQLKGFKTGGTIHIAINNQVGFTTNYIDGRSSTYCTDVAKTTLSPVFHVNGDDPEAMIKVMRLALEYRQKFHKDIFIDMLCYRKYGHNEGDEPRFTQPILYDLIAKHPNARVIYLKKLLETDTITDAEAEEFDEKYKNLLQERLDESQEIKKARITNFMADFWKNIKVATDKDFEQSPETGYPKNKLISIGKNITQLPKDKKIFRKIQRLMDERLKMITDSEILDWGMAELLAYGSLVDEGYPVRLTGQDCERGTFSHRHAVINFEDTDENYIPLQHLDNKKQADFHIFNSPLNEYGVMGYEYGYAMANPNGLNIWEAQFGDFYNGAQIIVDQFIAAAEEKWHVMNGLVLFMPHGYEGQGSEHSSGRIERFLQLCAKNNMQVANCTTPANFYHILRRQLHRPFRKPLIIFTPKSLLRHPKCISTLDELAKGRFLEVIDDTEIKNKNEVETLVLCSGKFYYDLRQKREDLGIQDTAFVRIEQLYPFPEKQIDKIIGSYKNAKKIIWAQEEPENMGAWSHIYLTMGKKYNLEKITLSASGAPATGSHKAFDARHEGLLDRIFKNSLVTK